MNPTTNTRRLAILLLALAAVLVAVPHADAAAKITVLVADGPGEGFNDPAPAAPVGGNTGTTLGQQRLIAFQYAANTWGATLDSNVEVFIQASFDPLPPNVLGRAGATSVFANFGSVSPFPGPVFSDTWYSKALADKRSGVDQDDTIPDIVAQFSSDFPFYLGLDNNHGPLNDLVVVLLHEFGHGLGFQNFVTETTGENLGPPFLTDVYSQFTLDKATHKNWASMTDAERAASAIRFGGVVWDGPEVTAGVPQVLSLGSPFLRIDAPPAVAGLYQFGTAAFGPPLASASVSGAVALASPNNGCTPIVGVAGRIALIDRGVCTFVSKVKNAQNAGAIGVIIANNAAGIVNMGGADPTITIPTVSIGLTEANAIKAQLGVGVAASFGVDATIRAGADELNQARLFAVNPVQLGSSISHYDAIASRNLLMEPAINADLTHNLAPPDDLTLPLMRDIGWFPDADTDGVADGADQCAGSDTQPFVVIGGCNSGVPNPTRANGCTTLDPIHACAAAASNHGGFVSCVAHEMNDLKKAGLITGAQKGAIQSCAAGANIP
jgi:hypothetical protein